MNCPRISLAGSWDRMLVVRDTEITASLVDFNIFLISYHLYCAPGFHWGSCILCIIMPFLTRFTESNPFAALALMYNKDYYCSYCRSPGPRIQVGKEAADASRRQKGKDAQVVRHSGFSPAAAAWRSPAGDPAAPWRSCSSLFHWCRRQRGSKCTASLRGPVCIRRVGTHFALGILLAPSAALIWVTTPGREPMIYDNL